MIDNAKESVNYINRYGVRGNVNAEVVLVVPYKDEIIERYKYKCVIFEGPEDDVLERFAMMADNMNPDFICRITADCPILPSFLVTKHCNVATHGDFDYVSNVDEHIRTCIDGHDVEVMSRAALDWAANNATSKYDREHVTPILRGPDCPKIFKIGHVIGHVYQPHYKLSIDTLNDLERVRAEYEAIKKCIELAVVKDGRSSVFRI